MPLAMKMVNAEMKSFEDLRRRAPVQPLLVFLTNTGYHRLRSLLRNLKPASPDVVIYYANRLAPVDATQLGKLVGEMRPNHTCVVFGAKAAAASVLAIRNLPVQETATCLRSIAPGSCANTSH
jgi:hypothetical protein